MTLWERNCHEKKSQEIGLSKNLHLEIKNQLTKSIHKIVISFFVLFLSRKYIEKEADDIAR